MPAINDNGYVNIDYVAVFERLRIGDAVADYVID